MKINHKKELAARTLGVGKNRILFNQARLNEIKEAITKQDIMALANDGAITIREINGRRKNEARGRRRAGSIKKAVIKRKEVYIILTRKLRKYAAALKKQGTITLDEYYKLRKEIRTKNFRNKSHMKERIDMLAKERK